MNIKQLRQADLFQTRHWTFGRIQKRREELRWFLVLCCRVNNYSFFISFLTATAALTMCRSWIYIWRFYWNVINDEKICIIWFQNMRRETLKLPVSLYSCSLQSSITVFENFFLMIFLNLQTVLPSVNGAVKIKLVHHGW